MQVRAVTSYSAATLGFSAISDGLAIVQEGGYVRLLYGARNDSRLGALTLGAQVAPAPPGADDPVIGINALNGIALQDTTTTPRAFVHSIYDAPLRQTQLDASGALGATKTTSGPAGLLYRVTEFEIVEFGGTDVAVVAQSHIPGLRLMLLANGGDLTPVSGLVDGPKTYLADIGDVVAVRVGGRSFVLASSPLENGVTCYEVQADGTASFVDALGAPNGLPVAGPDAMQSVQMGGTTFVVVASTLSDSLTVLRVNPMGVLFAVDHLVDDRDTRFDAVQALDLFAWAGRSFVVAAGRDAGLTVVELLPDGSLSPLVSLPLETGAGLGNVTGIKTAVIGDTATLLLTEASGDRLHRFEIDLQGIGPQIMGQGGSTSGTALDDRILGSAQADTLMGGAGDDFLHDAAATDLLWGGLGSDVFVFAKDGAADRIADFEAGIDKIDLGAWGRIYSATALTLSATGAGATVSYGTEVLTVVAASGQPLVLTDADFLF